MAGFSGNTPDYPGIADMCLRMLPKQNVVGSSHITRSPEKPVTTRETATLVRWPFPMQGPLCTKCVQMVG
jgi:hypothetical protein